MKTKHYLTLFFTVFISVLGFAQMPFSIVGKWKSEEKKDLFIEIYKANDGYFYGKNKEGKNLLHQLIFDAKSNSYVGKMKPADKAISIQVNLYLLNNERIKLVGKKLLFSKTFYLVKIK